jgi:hypothetical protein
VVPEDRPGRAGEALCQRYGRRMSVEALFRDPKSRRNGFALRNTKIQKAERFDRFLSGRSEVGMTSSAESAV